MSNTHEIVDIYALLALEYGEGPEAIKNKIKQDRINGRISTQQQKYIYQQILEILAVPAKKDEYDHHYLDVMIGDKEIAAKVWCTQRVRYTDYYQVLEVEKEATINEIRKNYRRLSKIHHPDKKGNSTEKSQEMFTKLADGHQILTDSKARKYYDIIKKNYMRSLNILNEEETETREQQKEEDPLQRKKRVERRQVFIKNFEGSFRELREALLKCGKVDRINKVGAKMIVARMKTIDAATRAVARLQEQKIGKHRIKIGLYKSLEQLREEKSEAMETDDNGEPEVVILN